MDIRVKYDCTWNAAIIPKGTIFKNVSITPNGNCYKTNTIVQSWVEYWGILEPIPEGYKQGINWIYYNVHVLVKDAEIIEE